jgi:hypothetical protein
MSEHISDEQHIAANSNINDHHYHHETVTTTQHNDAVAMQENSFYEEYVEKPAAPVKRPFYKNKKYWLICSILTVIIVVVVVVLILFVAFPKIAQSLLNKSRIEVDAAQISFDAPTGVQSVGDANSTFYMHMKTNLKNTGPFSANIQFIDNVDVVYNDTILGHITLPDTHISGGSGQIDTVTPFIITDAAAFTAFSQYMLAAEKFTWTLNGKAKITALSRCVECYFYVLF